MWTACGVWTTILSYHKFEILIDHIRFIRWTYDVRIQCDVVTAKLLLVRGVRAKWFCGCFMHSLIYVINISIYFLIYHSTNWFQPPNAKHKYFVLVEIGMRATESDNNLVIQTSGWLAPTNGHFNELFCTLLELDRNKSRDNWVLTDSTVLNSLCTLGSRGNTFEFRLELNSIFNFDNTSSNLLVNGADDV